MEENKLHFFKPLFKYFDEFCFSLQHNVRGKRPYEKYLNTAAINTFRRPRPKLPMRMSGRYIFSSHGLQQLIVHPYFCISKYCATLYSQLFNSCNIRIALHPCPLPFDWRSFGNFDNFMIMNLHHVVNKNCMTKIYTTKLSFHIFLLVVLLLSVSAVVNGQENNTNITLPTNSSFPTSRPSTPSQTPSTLLDSFYNKEYFRAIIPPWGEPSFGLYSSYSGIKYFLDICRYGWS